jgi:hypothetical protein
MVTILGAGGAISSELVKELTVRNEPVRLVKVPSAALRTPHHPGMLPPAKVDVISLYSIGNAFNLSNLIDSRTMTDLPLLTRTVIR